MIQPSLALIPTGYKDGKLYSVLPESGAGDFDVVRGSGATRVNKEGLVEDVRILSGELVTNGDFATDSDWTKDTGWSISGGSANCDGIGVNSLQQNTPTIIGKTYKLTFDVISDSTSDFLIISTNFGDTYIQGSETIIGANTFYITPTNGTGIRFRVANGTTLSIDNISIKEVTEDTNIPRLDYTGGGCPSLLLEPQSTNLVTHSEDFSDASWDKNATLIVTSNNAISPDGTQNATRVNKVSSGGRLGVDIPITSGQSYTLSFYMKNNGGNTSLEASFDGQSANQSYTITDNWERYEFTFIATTTKTSQIRLFQAAVNIDAHIWGAQLEALPYATSYIPTSGQIATRLADKVSGAGDATTFNSTEGVLYAEIEALANSVAIQRLSLSDGTSSNRVYLQNSTPNNQIFVSIVSEGVASVNFNITSYDTTQFNKIAIKYKGNDSALWINGIEVATDTGAVMPIGLSELAFDDGNGSLNYFGKVKDLRTYNTALTDAELTELTTI